MIQRVLKPFMGNSFMLFGPRGVGKTTFLEHLLGNEKEIIWINLLLPEEEDKYSIHPSELLAQINATAPPRLVVIDEIQKVPKLLDVVHHAIEKCQARIFMTGSSARKIKRGSSNLLAGRAFVYHLHPFTQLELGGDFDLSQAMNWGTLPKVHAMPSAEERRLFLQSYAMTYLKEEVWYEHLIRKMEPFRKFVEVAAQCHGEPLNYSQIARDVGVEYKTVQCYYEILEDTLMGVLLEPYGESLRKRQGKAPKFYFFDPGVKRAFEKMLTVEVVPNTYAFGKAFEHFLVTEFLRLNSYFQRDYDFSYLRTKDGAEIDLVIKRPGRPPVFLEFKSTEHIQEKQATNLNRFLDGAPAEVEGYCLSRDPAAKKFRRVMCLPWQEGLRRIYEPGQPG